MFVNFITMIEARYSHTTHTRTSTQSLRDCECKIKTKFCVVCFSKLFRFLSIQSNLMWCTSTALLCSSMRVFLVSFEFFESQIWNEFRSTKRQKFHYHSVNVCSKKKKHIKILINDDFVLSHSAKPLFEEFSILIL